MPPRARRRAPGPSAASAREGKVPGVVYGLGGDPITLTVEWRELRAALVTEQGLNAVIHLDIDGETHPHPREGHPAPHGAPRRPPRRLHPGRPQQDRRRRGQHPPRGRGRGGRPRGRRRRPGAHRRCSSPPSPTTSPPASPSTSPTWRSAAPCTSATSCCPPASRRRSIPTTPWSRVPRRLRGRARGRRGRGRRRARRGRRGARLPRAKAADGEATRPPPRATPPKATATTG